MAVEDIVPYCRGHGVHLSPVWGALAIVCFQGFFRFLYKVACLIVAAVLMFAILGGLVF